MKLLSLVSRALVVAALLVVSAQAQVVLVEPGHALVQHVDSAVPLHPSQLQLDANPNTQIESIAIDPPNLYVQLMDPLGGAPGFSTDIYIVMPGGVVAPVSLGTGFGINERGTDMHWDPATGLLVTLDENFLPLQRIATVNPFSGVTGTYSLLTPPLSLGATFGMQFSTGAGGSVVPPNDIVFTQDVSSGGIHSATFTGPTQFTHVPPAALPGGGDDMVIQPNGDWIWVGDFATGLVRYAPFPPHVATPSPLNVQAMFTGAGLTFINGTRATVCPMTGAVYVSYSGATGGSGVFRVNAALTTATLVATIGGGTNEGLQDMVIGPSLAPSVTGLSLFFTVHDSMTMGEEVWELTDPCPAPPPLYPGTQEDFFTDYVVNFGPAVTVGGGTDVVPLPPGSNMSVVHYSPGGTFVANSNLIVYGSNLPTGVPFPSPFPGVWVSPASYLIYGNLISGIPPLLPPFGFGYNFNYTGGLAGVSSVIQGLVLAPFAANGILATTNGLEIQFL